MENLYRINKNCFNFAIKPITTAGKVTIRGFAYSKFLVFVLTRFEGSIVHFHSWGLITVYDDIFNLDLQNKTLNKDYLEDKAQGIYIEITCQLII